MQPTDYACWRSRNEVTRWVVKTARQEKNKEIRSRGSKEQKEERKKEMTSIDSHNGTITVARLVKKRQRMKVSVWVPLFKTTTTAVCVCVCVLQREEYLTALTLMDIWLVRMFFLLFQNSYKFKKKKSLFLSPWVNLDWLGWHSIT